MKIQAQNVKKYLIVKMSFCSWYQKKILPTDNMISFNVEN